LVTPDCANIRECVPGMGNVRGFFLKNLAESCFVVNFAGKKKMVRARTLLYLYPA